MTNTNTVTIKEASYVSPLDTVSKLRELGVVTSQQFRSLRGKRNYAEIGRFLNNICLSQAIIWLDGDDVEIERIFSLPHKA